MNWGQYAFPSSPWSIATSGSSPATWSTSAIAGPSTRPTICNMRSSMAIGWESWENVWGIWNGINPRDAEATRRVATIERAVAPFLVSPDWEPLYPMHNFGVYASRWPLATETVWTIVNRNSTTSPDVRFSVPLTAGMRYFDLYHGVELKPDVEAQSAVLQLRP